MHFLCDIIKDIDQTDLHRSELSSRNLSKDELSLSVIILQTKYLFEPTSMCQDNK